MYLIIGNKGQLGKAFEKRFVSDNVDYYGADICDIDISKSDDVYKLIKAVKPDIIINCAAYNNVDEAERVPWLAFEANSKGVMNLATISEDLNIKLIHYSSDYVFDGTKKTLYIEEDKPNPINEYGKSKYSGEVILKSATDNYLIFRLSWVFGDGNQNFIYKFLRWASSNEELEIAENEVSIPTFTESIVAVTLNAIVNDLRGLYHLTSGAYTSRYGWALKICTVLKLSNKLIPVQKEKFNSPARRPDFSAMNNRKISDELNIIIPRWDEVVEQFLLR